MSFLKNLSEKFYQDAKTLNYTWMDLVKKTTRQKVINDVILFQNKKMIKKAEEDTIRNKLIDKQLKLSSSFFDLRISNGLLLLAYSICLLLRLRSSDEINIFHVNR